MVGFSDGRMLLGNPDASRVDRAMPQDEAQAMSAVLETAIAFEALTELFGFLEQSGLLGPETERNVGEFLGTDPRTADAAMIEGLDRDALVDFIMNRLAENAAAPRVAARAPQYGQCAPAGTMRAGDLQRMDDYRLKTRNQPAPRAGTPDAGGTAGTPTAPPINGAPASRQLVPPQRTPLSGTQAKEAIRQAWAERYGEQPSERTLAVLTAQWALETGRGRSMMNYNFGGIKGTGPSGLSTQYGTREGWGANEVRIRDNFRAYNNAAEGASDYLSLLDRRYPEALAAARAGDAEGFVHGLKRRGYFTGNEGDYVRNVSAMTNQALAQGFDALGARTAVA